MNNIGCGLCGAIDKKLFRCSRCKSVSYCSKEHQKEDWKKEHKLKCFVHQSDIKYEDAFEGTSRASDDRFCENQPSGNYRSRARRTSKKGIVSKEANSTVTNKVNSINNGTGVRSLDNNDWNTSLFTDEGSSESEILNARTETLRPEFEYIHSKSRSGVIVGSEKEREKEELNRLADISLNGPPFLHCDDKASILEEVSINVIRDMDAYGVCVVDHFLGPEMGKKVLDEVITMYSKGVFKDGQTVNARATSDVKTIRGDQITWLDGKESQCKSIGSLITKVDTVIKQANKVTL